MRAKQRPAAIPVTLADRVFKVPRLPLGVNIVVYPICQRLTNAGLVSRILARADVSEEEMGDLTELAFQAAHLADESIDTAAFLAMTVSPPELFAAFFALRLQTGAWNLAEEGDGQGEGRGTDPSPTSTSTASSPSSSDTSTSLPSIG
jgi:hypothetical protein